MPKKYPPVPRAIVLPGDFRVKTKLASKQEMAKEGLKDAYAGWEGSQNGGTIFIDKTLTYHERWSSYIHEMHHAITDWDHYIREIYITPFLIEVGETIEHVKSTED